MPVTDETIQKHAAHLVAPGLTLEARLEAITEVRDLVDHHNSGNEGAGIVVKLWTSLLQVMELVAPSAPNTPAHQIRNNILDILARITTADAAKGISNDLMTLSHNCLQNDNEENGLIAQRISLDLHRTYRPSMEGAAMSYINFAVELLKNIPAAMERAFGLAAAEPPAVPPFVPAKASLKLPGETTLQMMFICNLYPQVTNVTLPQLLPHLLSYVKMEGPVVHPDHQDKAYYDLKNGQVKALNFLSFLLRSQHPAINPFKDDILPGIVVAFRTCPDAVMMRKELLACARHILTTPLRTQFYKDLETLLDERFLVGRSRACQQELRPLSYSMLAEMVHHVRVELTLTQLDKIVYMFCRNIHDSTLPVNVQATSVRLLMNLVEVIHSRRTEADRPLEPSRILLYRILDTLVDKLESLRKSLPRHLELAAEVQKERRERGNLLNCQVREERTGLSADPPRRPGSSPPLGGDPAPAAAAAATAVPGGAAGGQAAKGAGDGAEANQGGVIREEEPKPPLRRRPILHTIEKSDKERELSEVTVMLSTLLMGIKTVFYCLCMMGNVKPVLPPGPNMQNVPVPVPTPGLRDEEIRLAVRALEAGAPCLRLPDMTGRVNAGVDVYDLFADMFSALQDHGRERVLVEVFGQEMEFLFDSMVIDPKLVRFAGALLQSANVGRQWASLLLRHLMDVQLPKLNRPNSVEGALTLKLMTLFFDALGKLPVMELVLQPVFHNLISKTMDLLRDSKAKRGYLELLLALFRTLNAPVNNTQGKYEGLYAAFGGANQQGATSLVAPLLSLLRSLLDGPVGPRHREALLELCLIMPARLQDMLGHLSVLMRPLVAALRSTDDLVSHALRILEHWVDSLNPEFLEPPMAAVAPQLMLALWAHLKPSPAPFGHKVVQLLGKLGGRNRRFLKEPTELEYKENPEHGMRLILTFHPTVSFLIPLDKCLQLARGALAPRSRPDHNLRAGALKLLQVCCGTYSNLRSPDDYSLPGTAADKLTAVLFGSEPPPSIEVQANTDGGGVKTKTQLLAERQVLRELLASCLRAMGDEDLKAQATPFARGVCRHYALLFNAGAVQPPPALPSTLPGIIGERGTAKAISLKELDPHLFLDALVMVLVDEIGERARSAAVEALATFVDTMLLVAGAQVTLDSARLAATPSAVAEGTPASGAPPGTAPVPASVPQSDGGPSGGQESQTPNSATDGVSAPPPRPKPRMQMMPDGSGLLVLDDLLMRILHCCFRDTWTARLGGLAGIRVFTEKLPLPHLRVRLHSVVRGLLNIQRHLPNHAKAEQEEVKAALDRVLSRALLDSKPPPYDIPDSPPPTPVMTGPQGSPEASPAAASTPQERNEVGEPPAEAAPAAGGQASPHTPAPPAGAAAAAEGDPKVERRGGSASQTPAGPASASGQRSSKSDDRLAGAPTDPHERMIYLLVNSLATEILTPRSTPSMRAMADRCLLLVRRVTGKTVAELLGPSLEKMNPPMEKRRLLPFKHIDMQCGILATMTYCIRQHPPLLQMSPELVLVAGDCYQVLDMFETTAPASLPTVLRAATAEQHDTIRKSCMSFLSALMRWDQFRDSNEPYHVELRGRIIQTSFKHLTSSSKEMVELAEAGLRSVVTYQKIPKNLLQTSLRPILVNLAFYNKLKLPLLRGLERLLTLLASWFNVALGDKLIDHLRKWLEPDKLVQERTAWERGQDAAIAAALLDLFHLLPHQASKFLETADRPGLVVLVIELENALASMQHNVHTTVLWSPYREPLAKFLNKYTAEAVLYFTEPSRMGQRPYFYRFLDILQKPCGRPLLLQVAASHDRLLALLNMVIDPDTTFREVMVHTLQLIDVMCSLLPDWLPEPLFRALHVRWNDPERRVRVDEEQAVTVEQIVESKRIAKAMLSYIARNHGEIPALFDLLDIFTQRTRVNFTFLKDFLPDVVCKTFTLDERKEVLRYFIQCYKERSRSEDQLVQIARLLILPMVDAGFDANEVIIDEEAMAIVVSSMFDPPEELAAAYGDAINMELLQLATILLKRAPADLINHKKEVIKFGWNHLKRDDGSGKYHAFLNVCHFLDAYQAPEKIVLQVFVALLRTTQTDGRRQLVRNALDVLTPALVRRLGYDPKAPIWVRYTRKVLSEEQNSLPQMVHIWQLIVRHADMFYTSRGQFVGQMVPLLMKIGLHHQSPVENKRLALDIAGLVVYWEQMRIAPPACPPLEEQDKDEEMSEDGGRRPRTSSALDLRADSKDDEERPAKKLRAAEATDADSGASVGAGGNYGETGLPNLDSELPNAMGAGASSQLSVSRTGDDDYRPTPLLQEHLIQFLGRMPFLCSEAKDGDSQALYWPALDLLEEAVRVFKGAPLRMTYLEKLIQTPLAAPAESVQTLITGLEETSRIMEHQPGELVAAAPKLLSVLVEAIFLTKSETAIDLFCNILHKMLVRWQLPTRPEQLTNMPPDVQAAFVLMQTHCSQHLQSVANPQYHPPSLCGLTTTMRIMRVMEDLAPEWNDVLAQPLINFISKVAVDHSSAVLGQPGALLLGPPRQGVPPPPPQRDMEAPEPEFGSWHWIFIEALRLGRRKLMPNEETRKLFTVSFQSLYSQINIVKATDPAVLYNILLAVRDWLVTYKGLGGKGASRMVQCVCIILRTGLNNSPYLLLYENVALEMHYHLMTDTDIIPGCSPTESARLRDEVFSYEKAFMTGLRCRDPKTRAKFFQLYHKSLPLSLFERLKFIVATHEWEHVSSSFWLKHALDILLAVLVEEEPIKLAPNSAQVAPLLGATHHNAQNMRSGQQGRSPHGAPGAPPPPQQAAAVPPASAPGAGPGPGPLAEVPPGAATMNAVASVGYPPPSLAVPGQGLPAPMQFYPYSGPVQPAAGSGLPLGLSAAPVLPQGVPQGVPQGGPPGVAHLIPIVPPRVAGMQAQALPMGTSGGAVPMAPVQSGQWGPSQATPLQGPPQSMALAAPPGQGQQQDVVMADAPPIPPPGNPPESQGAAPAAPAAHVVGPGQLPATGPDQTVAPSGSPVEGLPPEVPMPAMAHPPPEQLVRNVTADLQLPQDVDDLLKEHSDFLYASGRLQVRDLVESLSAVAYGDNWMAAHLWVLVFPIVWATLSERKEQQINLAKPIIMLLSKEYHSRQANLRPNVVQALLEGISLSQPQPKIPSELIKYLGKTFNAWHCAIPLLESHVILFSQEARCSDALGELYELLSEEDVLVGLYKKRGGAHQGDPGVDDTRSALTLLQHGLLDRALEGLVEAIRRYSHPNGPQLNTAAAKGEMLLWCNSYMKCCKELNEWGMVAEAAQSLNQANQQCEVLWRNGEWANLKDIVSAHASPVVGPQMEPSSKTEILRAYIYLIEGQVLEGDGRTQRAMQLALEQWWSLPEVGYVARVPLLCQFQQLVELQESTRILVDLSGPVLPVPRMEPTHAELKELLETWRLRTPNEWDRLTIWSNVLVWRNHIYNIVINAFKTMAEVAPTLHQLGYRDKAWSVNRLGSIARKHGCPEACKTIINQMYGFNAMEVQEAFVKVQEQTKAFLSQGPDQGYLIGGLNLINTQILDFFKPEHQAEFFRLKALLHVELNEPEDASQSFATALRLSPTLAEGWVSWGSFALMQYKEFGGASKLEGAIVAYLQGMRFASAKARRMIPRILNLMAMDPDEQTVQRAVRSGMWNVPIWVWLPYLHQLQASLVRPEALLAKELLVAVGQTFPQALYSGLRAHLLILREAAMKAVAETRQQSARAPSAQNGTPGRPAEAEPASGAGAGGGASAAATSASGTATQPPTQGGASAPAGPQTGTPAGPTLPAAVPSTVGGENQPRPPAEGGPSGEQARPDATPSRMEKPVEVMGFELGKEVMDTLRQRHPHISGILEVFLQELGQRFVPKAEERLLAVVHALLHRCYKMPYANNAAVPVSLKRELAGVCKACFSGDSVNRHGRAMMDYRESFVADLSPESPTFATTLGDLAQRLKAWRATLQATVEDTMPPFLRLEDESRPLQEQALSDVEMPGQWLNGEEVHPDQAIMLERIGADVAIVRRHSSSYRRLQFVGSDGKTRYFLVQTGQHNTVSGADDRMLQLLRGLNGLMDRHPESRRRQLAYYTPVMVVVHPQVRIIEEEPSFTTYGEAYEVNCARYGREADLPITQFKRRCASVEGALHQDPTGEYRLRAYQEIEAKYVTENVFSQYMYKTLPSPQSLWAFKRTMCVQLALSGLLQYTMLIGGRTPNKILFAKATGRVYQQDFCPIYDTRLVLEKNESVPFRLTRNLATLFTPFGVEGNFVTTLSVSAQALLARKDFLQDLLILFLREDIVGFQGRRSGAGGRQMLSMRSSQVRTAVDQNCSICMTNFRTMAPLSFEEHKLHPGSVNRGAQELVAQAQTSKLLCRMDATWHPWL